MKKRRIASYRDAGVTGVWRATKDARLSDFGTQSCLVFQQMIGPCHNKIGC